MRLRIDESLCTGHGRCYALAPHLFEADDRGYGVVTVDEVPEPLRSEALRSEALRSEALSAVQNCPERAITLSEG
jgi:ferredoxin